MTNSDFWKLFFHISLFSITIPCIVLLLTWVKQPKPIKVFGIGMFVYLCIFGASVFIMAYKDPDLYSYLSTLSDCLFFSLFYSSFFKNKPTIKSAIGRLGLAICLLLVIEYCFLIQKIDFFFYAFTCKNVFILTTSIWVVRTLLLNLKVQNTTLNAVFWIALPKAIIVSYSLLFELFEPMIIEATIDIYSVLYATDLLLHILMQIAFARAFFLAPNTRFST